MYFSTGGGCGTERSGRPQPVFESRCCSNRSRASRLDGGGNARSAPRKQWRTNMRNQVPGPPPGGQRRESPTRKPERRYASGASRAACRPPGAGRTRRRVFRAEVEQGVDRVTNTAPLHLKPAHRELFMPGDRQVEHLRTHRRRRQFPITLMGRHGRRREQDLIQRALLAATLGQQKMSVMHRVERPAKQSHAHHTRLTLPAETQPAILPYGTWRKPNFQSLTLNT